MTQPLFFHSQHNPAHGGIPVVAPWFAQTLGEQMHGWATSLEWQHDGDTMRVSHDNFHLVFRTQLDDARSRGLDVIATQTTNQRGEVMFDNLTPGLYLVEESAPDTKYEYHLSSPKLLILPLPDERGIRYEYENVLVMKWDKSYGTPPPWEPSEPPSTTPTKPGKTVTTTKTTTSTPPRVSTTIRTTYTTTPPGGTPTTVTTTVPSTIVTTKPNGVVTTVTHPRAVPEGERGSLASTGANVLWAAGLGGLLIVLGLFLARRSKNETR